MLMKISNPLKNAIPDEFERYMATRFLLFSLLYILFFISEANTVIYEDGVMGYISSVHFIKPYVIVFQLFIIVSSIAIIVLFFMGKFSIEVDSQFSIVMIIPIFIGIIATISFWVVFAMSIGRSKITKIIRWVFYIGFAIRIIDDVDHLFPALDNIYSLLDVWMIMSTWGGLACLMLSLIFLGQIITPPRRIIPPEGDDSPRA